MRSEYFSGRARRGYVDGDPVVIGARLAHTVRRLCAAAPEVFPVEWEDEGWYAKARGQSPIEVVDLSEMSVAEWVCRRAQREVPDGPEVDITTSVTLGSRGTPLFELSGGLGTFAGGEVDLVLHVDTDVFFGVPSAPDVVCLSNDQRRAVVEILAEEWQFEQVEHLFYDSEDIGHQVVLPAVTDMEGRRRATGVRWKVSLGWYTYVDAGWFPVVPEAVVWPRGVVARRCRTGVVIQLGDDPAEVTPGLIAATRKAMGLEYIPHHLPASD